MLAAYNYRAKTTIYTYVSHRKVLIAVKVKEPRNRPGVAHSVPGGSGSQISMKFRT
jgi:hypothetical protein